MNSFAHAHDRRGLPNEWLLEVELTSCALTNFLDYNELAIELLPTVSLLSAM